MKRPEPRSFSQDVPVEGKRFQFTQHVKNFRNSSDPRLRLVLGNGAAQRSTRLGTGVGLRVATQPPTSPHLEPCHGRSCSEISPEVQTAPFISSLIRCTVPTPRPSSLATLMMPFPERSALRAAVFAASVNPWSPEGRAVCLGALQTRHHALADHRPLELSEYTHHLEHGLTGGCGGVESLLVQV